jgi:hypothetical protein|tara:strand:- start:11441 stop:11683 length:243 start_codon:yes stop_codon:yes gene_type:complete
MTPISDNIKHHLFGVLIDDINFIYLTDNEWYQINVELKIIEYPRTGNSYFSAWCIRVSDGQSLRIVGNVDQILLADAEYS